MSEIDQFEKEFYQIRSKAQKYKKYLTIVKIIGNIGFIYTFIIGDYWLSFLLWFLFFPDVDQIIRFFKKFKTKNY